MTDGIQMKEVLAKLHQLPVIPVVIQEVISSFSDPDMDSHVLAHKIEQDQGLTAKILRVANSSFYGLPRKIGSMQDAVVVMGFNNIRSLALSAGFVKAFPAGEESLFDRHAYWKRSFRVAAYAKALAKLLKQDQGMAFTAGMFHDIGQLVLDTCMQEQFSSVLEKQHASGEDLFEIEKAILGFDHIVIGAEVAKYWNFPQSIEHVIRFWHLPDQNPFEPVTGIVHVAALIESGLSGDALASSVSEVLRERLRINWADIEEGLPDTDEVNAGANLLLSA
ncbi:HDOD domain-containing protein [Sulfurirhabdus autotrophica]|uniref:Putative nucleotidyltransferase with HDIG domain n=1 Tax=Sulfurirhabdus autotrophica TaxID=1706046 RepID=A0A4R3YB46_9PROT|nr:HDOD domain-containing protein [Sulfurirhabdus autotrophica]TCV89655.1 putative nucleotidyltransferase with HDIG domain [Sulfurirhabdus autotrophica]